MESRGENASISQSAKAYEPPSLVDLGTLEELTRGRSTPDLPDTMTSIGGSA